MVPLVCYGISCRKQGDKATYQYHGAIYISDMHKQRIKAPIIHFNTPTGGQTVVIHKYIYDYTHRDVYSVSKSIYVSPFE